MSMSYVSVASSGGAGYTTPAGYTPSTITNTNTATGVLPGAVFEAGGTLALRGNQADLVINGVSLTDTLKGIQDRLNMLQPNQALEAEWDQLRELGRQYRQLEAELVEKQRAWDILRKQQG